MANEPMHEIGLRQPLNDKSTRIWHVERGKTAIKLVVPDGDPLNVEARKHFADADKLIARADDAKVKAGCLDGTCTASSGKLVSGIALFEGAWKTRAISRCGSDWSLPVGLHDRAELDFRKPTNLDEYYRNLGRKLRATAIAIEAEVADIGKLVLSVRVGTSYVPQPLELSDPETCKQWITRKVPCVVLEIENWPDRKIATAREKRCKEPQHRTKDECRFDEHFTSLYDLLTKPPGIEDRWLPYVGTVSTEACVENPEKAPGNYPALRCPGMFASQ